MKNQFIEVLYIVIGIFIFSLITTWLSLRDAEIEIDELKKNPKQCEITHNKSVMWLPCKLVNEKLAKVEM